MKYTKAEPGDKIAFTYYDKGTLGEMMRPDEGTAEPHLRFWSASFKKVEKVSAQHIAHLRRSEPERIVAGAHFVHHKKGTVYEVLTVTNRRSDNHDRFPVNVVFFEADNPAARADPFAKSFDRFLATMIPLEKP